MTVPNHDWAKKIAEPTTETIDHALQQTVRVKLERGVSYKFDGKGFVEKLTPQQTAAIHTLIRHAIAAELEKLVHSYNAKPGGLVSPANVAYHVAERAERIRSWVPSWNVVTEYPGDSPEEEHPFEYLRDALHDVAWADTHEPPLVKKMRMR